MGGHWFVQRGWCILEPFPFQFTSRPRMCTIFCWRTTSRIQTPSSASPTLSTASSGMFRREIPNLQGFVSSWLQEGVPHRCPHREDQQVNGFHHRYPSDRQCSWTAHQYGGCIRRMRRVTIYRWTTCVSRRRSVASVWPPCWSRNWLVVSTATEVSKYETLSCL